MLAIVKSTGIGQRPFIDGPDGVIKRPTLGAKPPCIGPLEAVFTDIRQ